ncbi:hypothetical protein N7520_009726 [Penicillium odoratum]|uniref:uncharacterized protein n=1 Tax=Penicillium odoratum TaxID=1167516 RepID=UPI002546C33A|nr:uncharacterized protein N7520_009726 [Penicillium odoratum]KAJ5654847.1 hypothetical protein N7490_001850 [Penicillium lividum]KAJ5752809.1 hypothetical protein N7520_009726 [Penicillium odoratum]
MLEQDFPVSSLSIRKTLMPVQGLSDVPEMDQSKLPAASFKHLFATQNVNVPPEAPVKTHAICKSDCLQSEKEDVVDWDSWLTSEVLSGEGPPPFG